MIIENGIVSEPNKELIIKFDKPFTDVISINGFTDSTTIETLDKFFDKYFRFSLDCTEWSDWINLTPMYLKNIPSADNIYIELKYVRKGTDTVGNLILKEFMFDITHKDKNEFQNQTCTTCVNTCSDFLVQCDDVFFPYELDKINCVQESIQVGVNNIYGHKTKYWRALPDSNSSDVIFKEYSLYEHEAHKCLKIMIPDNELPDNDTEFGMMEMDFFDMPFEIQILKKEWQSTYGLNSYPRRKDILYIEILDRLYQIDSAYLFNSPGSGRGHYYRVNLVKYQDEFSSYKNEEVKGELDDLVVSYDDIHGIEREEEFENITKPVQYDILIEGEELEHIEFYNPSILNTSIDLNSNWTVISNNAYNMSKIKTSDISVKYNNKFKLNKSATYYFWVNLNTNGTLKTDMFDISNTQFKINVNGTTIATETIDIKSNKWYGVAVVLSNTFNQYIVNIYEINELDVYTKTESKSTSLNNVFSVTKTLLNKDLAPLITKDIQTTLFGGKYLITNIRVYDKLVATKNNSALLTQQIVDDSERTFIIDNTTELLTYLKHNTSR